MIKSLIGLGILAIAISIPTPKEEVATKPKIVEIPVIEFEKTWKCLDCSPEEQYVLEQLQEHTKISDRNALATIMGNIKQESNFTANICEGGARVSYSECTRGGYGLIQWTSLGRYNNLGKFCAKYGCDPSTLEGQTRYMINESVFQRYLPEFEGRGKTVDQYMVPAYYWLGWGIKGNREYYSHNYSKKLVLA
tara:strand:- start:224 stop:802 length:579 start_codon:yes stop_codon:yes gene_type:complete